MNRIAKRDFLERAKKLYEQERTLYSHLAIEQSEARTREALEQEGHMSPERVPPREIAEMVRDGQ